MLGVSPARCILNLRNCIPSLQSPPTPSSAVQRRIKPTPTSEVDKMFDDRLTTQLEDPRRRSHTSHAPLDRIIYSISSPIPSYFSTYCYALVLGLTVAVACRRHSSLAHADITFLSYSPHVQYLLNIPPHRISKRHSEPSIAFLTPPSHLIAFLILLSSILLRHLSPYVRHSIRPVAIILSYVLERSAYVQERSRRVLGVC